MIYLFDSNAASGKKKHFSHLKSTTGDNFLTARDKIFGRHVTSTASATGAVSITDSAKTTITSTDTSVETTSAVLTSGSSATTQPATSTAAKADEPVSITAAAETITIVSTGASSKALNDSQNATNMTLAPGTTFF